MQEGVYQKPVRNVDELKQRLIEAWLGNPTQCMSKQLISGKNVLTRKSKPKTNTLNNYFDVFIHNCEFLWTLNACITVVMNRLTHVVFHKVV